MKTPQGNSSAGTADGCRKKAAECRAQAANAIDPVTKAAFLEFAARWESAAKTLEWMNQIASRTAEETSAKRSIAFPKQRKTPRERTSGNGSTRNGR